MITTSTKTKSTDQNKSASKPKVKIAAPRSAKSSRRSNQRAPAANAPVAAPARQVTKRDQLAALLVRDEGATLDQMIAATGWLPHTTRAALTGLRKAGYAIDSDKIDGVRTYRAVAPK